ncbi:hypothetical protein NQ041_22110 [Vibrio diabolicus]|uniref:hypothetical protein n=1 Tax=Vibrio diabolicus TaxID=50719 RepID=UPI00211BA51C|nr:hypothetical protein [Vibrio diabolicus]MCQ9247874.1 hypothetical protein [Vibrio diabolicus]
MKYTEHWSSERARRKQTALTKLANGLTKEVIEHPITKELFTPEELEAITIAAQALNNVKLKFTHLKEQKQRIEQRKAQEIENINRQCRQHAERILNSMNPCPNTFTKEQFCLWLMVCHATRNLYTPESWDLDVNDALHLHPSSRAHEIRIRNVKAMREQATKAFEKSLNQAWRFSYDDDKWTAIIPIQEAVEQLQNLKSHSEYANIERRYQALIEPLEAHNRQVKAIERRKAIRPVDDSG